ncbi:MAG: hypothetical protein A3H95_01990 [Acidobacteria bacterium RIFCSPLOWO2_02_FULL_64_15]|nr:MAG: hypothetical protein A3H95_01990 [Acidobacteria bacterium RIFCSPLOWO2_02_FULL_64_15]
MRDVVAALVAIALLVAAASLATTLTAYRRRRQRARDLERTLGRTIVAEVPTKDELVIVSEDAERFYYGDRPIDKKSIVAVRLLINGASLAAYISRRSPERPVEGQSPERLVAGRGGEAPTAVEDPLDGIARDRWDVAIETIAGTTLVECGAIRERVSQELARAVFDAIKRNVEARDLFEKNV